MTVGKLVLGVSALVLIFYGMVSLFSPLIPAGFAGLEMSNGDALAEVGAMYGGLQTGLGFFCLLALLKSELYQAGLVLLVFAIGALGLARMYFFLIAPEAVTAYTYMALMYEFATAILAAISLAKK